MAKRIPWPFGNDSNALEGYLLSLDTTRRITDVGHGVRVYPSSAGKRRGHVVDCAHNTCSNDLCRKRMVKCKHRWEDEFRFGTFAGQLYELSDEFAKKLAQRVKAGKPYSGARHLHSRPNPEIRGLKAATLGRHAREEIPTATKELAADLAHWFRTVRWDKQDVRGRGRPCVDLIDVIIAQIFRISEGWSYEELHSLIPIWARDGYLTSEFSYQRVVETMTGCAEVTAIMDAMAMRIEEFFRCVGQVFVTDGVEFSTRRSDNPRTSRATGDSIRILCHSQYEYRWGLLTGFRLTFARRGRGSGEAPQYPYISNMTRRIFRPTHDLADGAFSTDRNFAYADAHDYRLIAPIKSSGFVADSKKFLTPERAAFHLAECDSRNPGSLMNRIFTFRNRSEGWHSVAREKTRPYLISRPDRTNIPLTKAEDTKRHPHRSYLGLPFDQDERDAIIDTEQFVGRACTNEFYARRLGLHLRALTRAMKHYQASVNFFTVAPFEFIPEDEAYSIFRTPDIAA